MFYYWFKRPPVWCQKLLKHKIYCIIISYQQKLPMRPTRARLWTSCPRWTPVLLLCFVSLLWITDLRFGFRSQAICRPYSPRVSTSLVLWPIVRRNSLFSHGGKHVQTVLYRSTHGQFPIRCQFTQKDVMFKIKSVCVGEKQQQKVRKEMYQSSWAASMQGKSITEPTYQQSCAIAHPWQVTRPLAPPRMVSTTQHVNNQQDRKTNQTNVESFTFPYPKKSRVQTPSCRK